MTRAWVWYYRNFLCGFCYYLPLLILFLFPLALMLGVVGTEYGPRFLFFHDDPVKEIAVGVSLALFWTEVLLTGFLLWLRDLRHGRLAPNFEEWLEQRREEKTLPEKTLPLLSFQGYVWRTLGCIGFTLMSYWVIIQLGGIVLHALRETTGMEVEGAGEKPISGADLLLLGLPVALGMGATWLLTWVVGKCCHKRVGQFFGEIRLGEWLERRRKESQSPRARRMRRTGRIVLATLFVSLWLLLLLHLVSLRASGWPYWGTVLLAATGFLATILAPLVRGRWMFPLALVANLFLSYVGITWSISKCPYGILAGFGAAAACGTILGGSVWAFFPEHWERFLRAVAQHLEPMERPERIYLGWGGLYLIAIPPLLMGIAFCPLLASPVPIIVLALFGIVALYALFTYVIRRSFVIVAGLVVLFALVSHVQQYAMQFEEGLPFYSQEKILNLEQARRLDNQNQDQFEDTLREYVSIKEGIDELEETTRNRMLALNPEEGNLSRQSGFQTELKRLKSDLDEGKRKKQEWAIKLKEAWQKIERENRLCAGRFLPSKQRELAELKLEDDLWPEARLLKTGHLKVWQLDASSAEGTPGPISKRPLIVIAVSGGGIRAAIWTFAVLKELELGFAEQGIDFPSRVRFITGASGGMVGAAYYVATLPPPANRPPQKNADPDWSQRKSELELQQALLSSDFLTPLTGQMILNDFPNLLSLWPLKHDRGKVLEQTWSYFLKDPRISPEPGPGPGALDVSFRKLRADEKEGWRPSLVFTPMMVEDGRRLIISNLDLRYPISNDGMVLTHNPSIQGAENHSLEALELFRMFPEAQDTLTLATAARMSASFPYFSPAVPLPTVPRRRVVDAGYYDNYGVSLSASWLFSDSTRTWLSKNFDRILLIQIRDSVTEKERQLRNPFSEDSSSLARTTEEFSSPIEALFSARIASSSFRNDGQLELLGQFQLLKKDQELQQQFGFPASPDQKPLTWKESPFLVVNFELDKTASLSWYLSNREKGEIKEAGENLRPKIQRIFEWWEKKDTMQAP